MPITPAAAAKHLDKSDAVSIEAAEKWLDGILARSYRSGGSVIIESSDLRKKVPYALLDRFFKPYRKAGWNIRHFSCQRDQTSTYTFSAKKSS